MLCARSRCWRRMARTPTDGQGDTHRKIPCRTACRCAYSQRKYPRLHQLLNSAGWNQRRSQLSSSTSSVHREMGLLQRLSTAPCPDLNKATATRTAPVVTSNSTGDFVSFFGGPSLTRTYGSVASIHRGDSERSRMLTVVIARAYGLTYTTADPVRPSAGFGLRSPSTRAGAPAMVRQRVGFRCRQGVGCAIGRWGRAKFGSRVL